MVKMSVRELAGITAGRLISKGSDDPVAGFSIDSRNIRPGQFFIAVKGHNHDGHDFVCDAVKMGASGVIAEAAPASDECCGLRHIIVVENTLDAMGVIASHIRKEAGSYVIAVSGTNGKTTVKDMLAHILSAKYRTLKSAKSYNNIIGLSLTLFEMEASHEVAVLELGTNHPGEISKLAKIAGPSMAVFTNIGDGHLEFFSDRKGVFHEKMSLLEELPEDGIAILNKDDSLLAGTSASDISRKFYGVAQGADYRVSGIKRDGTGYDFVVNGQEFRIPLEGIHNVHNAAAAIAAAECFGMGPRDISARLKNVSLPDMRLQKTRVNNVVFINDSYNANPNSFECALQVLRDDASGAKKVVVAGEMKELGKVSDEFHRMIGRSIAGKKFDYLITLGGLTSYMAEGAVATGMSDEKVLRAASHKEAADMLRSIAGSGEEVVVLLKGSRTVKTEEVIKCFTISYTR